MLKPRLRPSGDGVNEEWFKGGIGKFKIQNPKAKEIPKSNGHGANERTARRSGLPFEARSVGTLLYGGVRPLIPCGTTNRRTPGTKL
jgi:hypothetical protein